MSGIKTLIDEYVALTGRPAATLQVSEFIELKRYADEKKLSYASSGEEIQGSEHATTKKVAKQPIPFIDDMSEEMHEDVYDAQEEITTTNEDREENEAEEKDVSDITAISPALMLLRSIGG